MDPNVAAETIDPNLALLQTIQAWLFANGIRLILSIALFFIGRWISTLIVRGVRTLMTRAKVDETLANFAANLLYYVLLAVVIIAALNNIGVDTTSVIAIFGAATLAIGLALQSSLSNFAAGVMIIMFRPYKVGDLIETTGEFGKVNAVNIFTTIITTLDNKEVIIPNGSIMAGNIINYSSKGKIRIDLVFGIGYEDDLLRAKGILLDILTSYEKVLAYPAPSVNVLELADSSVNFAVRPYVLIEDYWNVYFHVTEQVKLRLDAEGISIPYPQRDIHVFRIDLVFGIGYEDDLLRAKGILLDILTSYEKVLAYPAPSVNVLELADSSVNFAVRPYVLIEDYWNVYFHVTEQVKLRLDAEGISIPYPQRDIHVFQAS